MARRFMYWQVYLHKTGLVAEQLLIKILQRAKELLAKGGKVQFSGALKFFMENKISKEEFSRNKLDLFAQLDDVDILWAVKSWQDHEDFVLSKLCKMILDRRLLHIKLKNRPINEAKLNKHFLRFKNEHRLTDEETAYFVFTGEIKNQAYNSKSQNINILHGNGRVTDVTKASDQQYLKTLSKTVTKYYMCYPKVSV